MSEYNKRVLIISGGTINQGFLKQFVATNPIDEIIAVDGGVRVAIEANIVPNIVLGDFDTIGEIYLEKYLLDKKDQNIDIVRLNPMKDSTDTHVAIQKAIDLGANEIVIFGATGTRFDHVLSNVHILMEAVKKGIAAYLMDEYNKIYLIDHSITKKKEDLFGDFLSLIPFTTKVSSVTLKGMKYPLSDYTLTIGDSIGVSNEVVDQECYIEFKDGILFVIESRD